MSMSLLSVGVGSTNPVKVAAVQQAITHVLQRQKRAIRFQVEGYEVASEVSPQPRSETETREGATNRAKNVLLKHAHIDLAVGMEGGVHPENDGLFSTVWVCVLDREGRKTEVNGARFRLPNEIAQPIIAGQEMGVVMDQLTGKTNIKHQEGMIGTLTGEAVTRQEEYENLVSLALGLYFKDWRGSEQV